MKNPLGKWGDDDRYIGHHIGYDGWASLFYEVLDVPKPETYIEGESYILYENRQQLLFEKHLATNGYPLLGRISDIYKDVGFCASEVYSLRDECERVRAINDNSIANMVLDDLLTGCILAIQTESGLALISD